MSLGQIIQLAALGVQNLYLNIKPQYTMFRKSYKRHTNYATQVVRVQSTNAAVWGKKVDFDLTRNGDLIAETYLVVQLPCITGGIHREDKWWPTAYKAVPGYINSDKDYYSHRGDHLVSHVGRRLQADSAKQRVKAVVGATVNDSTSWHGHPKTDGIDSATNGTTKETGILVGPSHSQVAYVDSLGHAIINDARFFIAQNVIQEFTGEYMHIHHLMNNPGESLNEALFSYGDDMHAQGPQGGSLADGVGFQASKYGHGAIATGGYWVDMAETATNPKMGVGSLISGQDVYVSTDNTTNAFVSETERKDKTRMSKLTDAATSKIGRSMAFLPLASQTYVGMCFHNSSAANAHIDYVDKGMDTRSAESPYVAGSVIGDSSSGSLFYVGVKGSATEYSNYDAWGQDSAASLLPKDAPPKLKTALAPKAWYDGDDPATNFRAIADAFKIKGTEAMEGAFFFIPRGIRARTQARGIGLHDYAGYHGSLVRVEDSVGSGLHVSDKYIGLDEFNASQSVPRVIASAAGATQLTTAELESKVELLPRNTMPKYATGAGTSVFDYSQQDEDLFFNYLSSKRHHSMFSLQNNPSRNGGAAQKKNEPTKTSNNQTEGQVRLWSDTNSDDAFTSALHAGTSSKPGSTAIYMKTRTTGLPARLPDGSQRDLFDRRDQTHGAGALASGYRSSSKDKRVFTVVYNNVENKFMLSLGPPSANAEEDGNTDGLNKCEAAHLTAAYEATMGLHAGRIVRLGVFDPRGRAGLRRASRVHGAGSGTAFATTPSPSDRDRDWSSDPEDLEFQVRVSGGAQQNMSASGQAGSRLSIIGGDFNLKAGDLADTTAYYRITKIERAETSNTATGAKAKATSIELVKVTDMNFEFADGLFSSSDTLMTAMTYDAATTNIKALARLTDFSPGGAQQAKVATGSSSNKLHLIPTRVVVALAQPLGPSTDGTSTMQLTKGGARNLMQLIGQNLAGEVFASFKAYLRAGSATAGEILAVLDVDYATDTVVVLRGVGETTEAAHKTTIATSYKKDQVFVVGYLDETTAATSGHGVMDGSQSNKLFGGTPLAWTNITTNFCDTHPSGAAIMPGELGEIEFCVRSPGTSASVTTYLPKMTPGTVLRLVRTSSAGGQSTAGGGVEEYVMIRQFVAETSLVGGTAYASTTESTFKVVKVKVVRNVVGSSALAKYPGFGITGFPSTAHAVAGKPDPAKFSMLIDNKDYNYVQAPRALDQTTSQTKLFGTDFTTLSAADCANFEVSAAIGIDFYPGTGKHPPVDPAGNKLFTDYADRVLLGYVRKIGSWTQAKSSDLPSGLSDKKLYYKDIDIAPGPSLGINEDKEFAVALRSLQPNGGYFPYMHRDLVKLVPSATLFIDPMPGLSSGQFKALAEETLSHAKGAISNLVGDMLRTEFHRGGKQSGSQYFDSESTAGCGPRASLGALMYTAACAQPIGSAPACSQLASDIIIPQYGDAITNASMSKLTYGTRMMVALDRSSNLSMIAGVSGAEYNKNMTDAQDAETARLVKNYNPGPSYEVVGSRLDTSMYSKLRTHAQMNSGFGRRAQISSVGNHQLEDGTGKCVQVVVPMPWWYAEGPACDGRRTQALPMIALQYHNVSISVNLRRFDQCVQTDREHRTQPFRCSKMIGALGANALKDSASENCPASEGSAVSGFAKMPTTAHGAREGGTLIDTLGKHSNRYPQERAVTCVNMHSIKDTLSGLRYASAASASFQGAGDADDPLLGYHGAHLVAAGGAETAPGYQGHVDERHHVDVGTWLNFAQETGKWKNSHAEGKGRNTQRMGTFDGEHYETASGPFKNTADAKANAGAREGMLSSWPSASNAGGNADDWGQGKWNAAMSSATSSLLADAISKAKVPMRAVFGPGQTNGGFAIHSEAQSIGSKMALTGNAKPCTMQEAVEANKEVCHVFSKAVGTMAWKTGGALSSTKSQLEIIGAHLLVTFIFLDSSERRLFASNAHEYLITQVQKQEHRESKIPMSGTMQAISMDLKFNHPVSHLFWVLQRPESQWAREWFRYEATHGAGDPLMIRAELSLNSSKREEEHYLNATNTTVVEPWNYFKKCNNTGVGGALRSHSFDGTAANIHTYSFSQNPGEWYPTGSLNFSRIDRVELKLYCKAHADSYLTHPLVWGGGGYRELNTELMNAAQTATVDGSGHVDTALKAAYGELSKGIDIRVYARNFNVLRIQSGMGAIKYAN